MEFDFLPSTPPPPEPKPNTESGNGSVFNVGEVFFIDTYLNHLDAHNQFRVPVVREDFLLKENYEFALKEFNDKKIQEKIKNGWYGDHVVLDKLKNGYTQFSNPELLNKVLNKLEVELPSDLFSSIEKPKIDINDRFGMFSYDLASMSMFYVYEYFTNNNKKVDANEVVKKGNQFLHGPTQKKVVQKIKRRKNGTPIVISNNKNCLIDFKKKDQQVRSVEIIVNNSFSWKETPEEILHNSLAAISVASNLISKGFKVKISCLITIKHTEGAKPEFYHFIPVKRYNQPLDINAAAYVCGDSKFFRFQSFKMILKGYDNQKLKTPDSYGYIISNKTKIAKTIEEKYVPNSKLKQADTRLYFGGSRNMEMVKEEVKAALEILNKKYGNENKN